MAQAAIELLADDQRENFERLLSTHHGDVVESLKAVFLESLSDNYVWKQNGEEVSARYYLEEWITAASRIRQMSGRRELDGIYHDYQQLTDEARLQLSQYFHVWDELCHKAETICFENAMGYAQQQEDYNPSPYTLEGMMNKLVEDYQQMVGGGMSQEAAANVIIELLSVQEIETLTSHPNRVNSPDFNNRSSKLDKAIENIIFSLRHPDFSNMTAEEAYLAYFLPAMQAFVDTNPDYLPGKKAPEAERNENLDRMENAYHGTGNNVRRMYNIIQKIDDPYLKSGMMTFLREKFAPTTYRTWTTVDQDNNPSAKADYMHDTHIEACARINRLYSKSLIELGTALPEGSEERNLVFQISAMLNTANDVDEEKLLANVQIQLNRVFDAIPEINRYLRWQTLTLMTQIRQFGRNFVELDFRQDAVIIEDIMAEVIDIISQDKNISHDPGKKEFKKRDPKAESPDNAAHRLNDRARCKIIDNLATYFHDNPKEGRRILETAQKSLAAKGHGQAVETIKSLWLMRDYPNASDQYTLASTQFASQPLSMMTLMYMANVKDKGVVPLNEDEAALKEPQKMLQTLFSNYSYLRHVVLYRGGKQKIMEAKSDTGRVMGVFVSATLVNWKNKIADWFLATTNNKRKDQIIEKLKTDLEKINAKRTANNQKRLPDVDWDNTLGPEFHAGGASDNNRSRFFAVEAMKSMFNSVIETVRNNLPENLTDRIRFVKARFGATVQYTIQGADIEDMLGTPRGASKTSEAAYCGFVHFMRGFVNPPKNDANMKVDGPKSVKNFVEFCEPLMQPYKNFFSEKIDSFVAVLPKKLRAAINISSRIPNRPAAAGEAAPKDMLSTARAIDLQGFYRGFGLLMNEWVGAENISRIDKSRELFEKNTDYRNLILSIGLGIYRSDLVGAREMLTLSGKMEPGEVDQFMSQVKQNMQAAGTFALRTMGLSEEDTAKWNIRTMGLPIDHVLNDELKISASNADFSRAMLARENQEQPSDEEVNPRARNWLRTTFTALRTPRSAARGAHLDLPVPEGAPKRTALYRVLSGLAQKGRSWMGSTAALAAPEVGGL